MLVNRNFGIIAFYHDEVDHNDSPAEELSGIFL